MWLPAAVRCLTLYRLMPRSGILCERLTGTKRMKSTPACSTSQNGAALMSGTTHDVEFVTGCYDILPNYTLCTLLLEAMQASDGIRFSEQERSFAKNLQATFPAGSVGRAFERIQKSVQSSIPAEEIDNPLWEQILPHSETPPLGGGSTEGGRRQLG